MSGRIKYGNSQIFSALYYKHAPPQTYSIFILFSLSSLSSPSPATLNTSPLSIPSLTSSPSLSYSTFPSPPHTMSKRVVRLIVISDFVSHQHIRALYPRLPFGMSLFPRPAHGVSSPIASFRMPSPSARTSQYRLRSNTGHSCSTTPLP